MTHFLEQRCADAFARLPKVAQRVVRKKTLAPRGRGSAAVQGEGETKPPHAEIGVGGGGRKDPRSCYDGKVKDVSWTGFGTGVVHATPRPAHPTLPGYST